MALSLTLPSSNPKLPNSFRADYGKDKLVLFLSLCLLAFFFLWRTARNCSKVRAARAAQFSRLTNQVFIIGAAISDPAVDADRLLS